MNTQFNPGPGYRLLQPDEVIRHGDEYFSAGEWLRRKDTVGILQNGMSPTRRKVETAIVESSPRQKLFRLLLVGEIVHPGDEVYDGTRWRPAREGVVTIYDAPIRREVFQFTGGPA